jgi:hypothetical protein
MSFSASDSAIPVTPELVEAAKNASFEELKELMHQQAISTGMVVPDKFSPDVLIPTAAATALIPKSFGTRISVDGKSYVLEADSPAALETAVNDFIRAQTHPAAPQTRTEQPQPRDAATGRFQSATEQPADAERKQTLLLQFQLGQIDAQTYLDQSGELSDYFSKHGIPLEEVKAVVQEKQDERFHSSWEQATTEFLQSEAGADWPGGHANLLKISDTVKQLGLEDSPSAESLTVAYKYLCNNDLLVPNPVAEAEQDIATATSYEALAAAARRSQGR